MTPPGTGRMAGTVVQRNSDVVGVVALAGVILAGLGFGVSVLGRIGPTAEYAALAVYVGATGLGAIVTFRGSRGREAAIASVVLAVLVGTAMLGLVVLRSAYAAVGPT